MNYIELRKDLVNMHPYKIVNDIFDIAYEKILFKKSIKQSVQFSQQMIKNHVAMSFLQTQQEIKIQEFYDNNINDIKDEIEPEIQQLDNRMTQNVKSIKIEQKKLQLQNSNQRTSQNISPNKSIHIKNPEPNRPFQTNTQQSTPLDIVEEYHRKQKSLLSENLIQQKNQQLIEDQKKQYLQKMRRQYKDFTYDYDGHIILIKNKKKIKFVPKPAKFGKIVQPKIRQQSKTKSKIKVNQDQSINTPEILDYIQSPPNIQHDFECQPGVTFIQDGSIKKQNKINERKYHELHELINQDETLQVSKREYKIITKNGNISKETCSLLDKSESNQNDIIFINEQDQTKITKKNNHININNQMQFKQMMDDKNQKNDFNLKNKNEQLPKISKYYNEVDKFNQQIVFNQDKWNQQNRQISQQQEHKKHQSKESLFKKTFRAVSFLNCLQDNYFFDDQKKKKSTHQQQQNISNDIKKNKIGQNSFHLQNLEKKDKNVNNRVAKSLHQKYNDNLNQQQKKIIQKYEDIFTHR